MLADLPQATTPGMPFDSPDLLAHLEAADDAALDALPFGVVAMAPDGVVVAYNATEARAAGLGAERVLGRHFFTAVAPCTNNRLVAHRYAAEPVLDATIGYTFTFKMAPQRVELRLLRHPAARRMYLLVRRG